MIVAAVDVRLVVENDEQLQGILAQLRALDRAYIAGVIESHYAKGQTPRSNINRVAMLCVKAKLDNKDRNYGSGEDTD